MATQDSIVGGLFTTPEQYQQALQAQALNQGINMARLSPVERAAAMGYAGAAQVGRGIAGAMGAEDPQLKLQSFRQQVLSGIDQTDPQSLAQASYALNREGDTAGARQLAQLAQEAALKQSQTTKNLREGNAAMLTTEQRNATGLADSSGAVRGTPEWADIYKTELTRLTTGNKGANIKEIGVAEGTRQPVYFDAGTDTQFVMRPNPQTGKQERVAFSGGVDRTTAKTNVGVKLPEGESEFVKRLGTKDADRVDAAITLRDTAVSSINSLNKLASLPADQLIGGQFAAGRVGATSLLSTLGLASPADVNKLNKSQEYQKVAGDVILQTLGGKLGSGFSNADRDFIASLVPQLETSSEARRQLIQFMQNKNQDIVQETIRLEDYARKNKGLSGYTPKIPLSVEPSKPNAAKQMTDAELKAIAGITQ
jgi:hypothetical protein